MEGQRLRLSSDGEHGTPTRTPSPTVLNARTVLVCTYCIESIEFSLLLPLLICVGNDNPTPTPKDDDDGWDLRPVTESMPNLV